MLLKCSTIYRENEHSSDTLRMNSLGNITISKKTSRMFCNKPKQKILKLLWKILLYFKCFFISVG